MMLELAANYDRGPIPLSEVAKRQDLPVKYLEQLIIPLKAARLIRSVRGAKGGYTLGRKPEKINLAQIIEILEGGLYLVDCVAKPRVCNHRTECPTRYVWARMSKRLTEELSALSLQDVLARK
jgi:Rrf2 family protein